MQKYTATFIQQILRKKKEQAQDGMKYELPYEHSLTSTLKFPQYNTEGGLMMPEAQFSTCRR